MLGIPTVMMQNDMIKKTQLHHHHHHHLFANVKQTAASTELQ